MSKDKDLLNQLNSLPDEAEAPDRWQAIQQGINNSTEEEQPVIKRSKAAWLAVAIAACALLLAILPMFNKIMVNTPTTISSSSHVAQSSKDAESAQPQQKTEARINPQYQLTINSLQQANAYYYAELGQKVRSSEIQLKTSTWSSLSSLRDAQQEYRHALVKQPNDANLQQRLFWLYEKERALLRQLVV